MNGNMNGGAIANGRMNGGVADVIVNGSNNGPKGPNAVPYEV